ncbi:MAG: hypothetical protein KDD47_16710 [Acidobacteria bacterium]|nr:hypothetical protein [Acidobacteriota bacterium]
MTDAFRTIEDYELFLYSLSERFPAVQGSTLVLARRGATLARVTGELFFALGFRVVVRERLTFDRLPVVIDSYGYEIWRGDEKLCWYDSQPHPDDPSLRSTHPHHKHVPPDMKRNRVPAENMSFLNPNLPALVEEIEALLEETKRD